MNRSITIVSLGPDDASLLTLGALETLRKSEHVFLRTARHGAVSVLKNEGIEFESLDLFYDDAEDFEELCEILSDYILKQAEQEEICYAVGDAIGDATVRALLTKAESTVAFHFIGGVSLAQNILSAAGELGNVPQHYHVLWAMALEGLRVRSEPQVICEINDRILASDVKLWLSDLYEDDTEILFMQNAADASFLAKHISLYDLDRQPFYDHRTAVFVPEIDVLNRSRSSYEDLLKVIAILRSPEGCPWDRVQTHDSLRRYMIEEACEAAEAMGGGDDAKIADELGDVLLQVVLNAQIGSEHRSFTERDVTTAITQKMISRHAHVFGSERANTPEETVGVWERAKSRERGEQSAAERVRDLPSTLPVLLRAQKAAKRVATAKKETLDGRLAKAKLIALLEQDSLNTQRLGEALLRLCEMAEAGGLDANAALLDCLNEKQKQLESEEAEGNGTL